MVVALFWWMAMRGAEKPPDLGSEAFKRADPPQLRALFITFLVVGVSAVGMGILQAIRSVPVRKGWMSQEEVDEGMGLVQLDPGAIMVDLIAYIGYRLRGIRGSLISVLAFIGPSIAMLLGLSWAFFRYHSHPVIVDLAVGLEALVVGVLVNMTIDFGAEHATGGTVSDMDRPS